MNKKINLCCCKPLGMVVVFAGAALPSLACPDQYSIGKASKDISQTHLAKNDLLASNIVVLLQLLFHSFTVNLTFSLFF